jgi:hypothetical protein
MGSTNEQAVMDERVLGTEATGDREQGTLSLSKDSAHDHKRDIDIVVTATESDDASSSSSSRASPAARVLAVGKEEEEETRSESQKKVVSNSTQGPGLVALEPGETVSTGDLRRSSSSSVEEKRQVATPTSLPSVAEPSSVPGTPGSSLEKKRILGTHEIMKGGQILSPRLPAVTESSALPGKVDSSSKKQVLSTNDSAHVARQLPSLAESSTAPVQLCSSTKKQMLSTKDVREGAGIGTLQSLPSVGLGRAAPGKPESTKKEVLATPQEPQAYGPRLPSVGESTATPGKSEASTKKEVVVDGERGPRLPSVGEASAAPGKLEASTKTEVAATAPQGNRPQLPSVGEASAAPRKLEASTKPEVAATAPQGNRPQLPSVGESSAVPAKPESSAQKEVLSTTQEMSVDSRDSPRLPSVAESSTAPGGSEPSKEKDNESKDHASRPSRFPRFIEKTKSDGSVGYDGHLKKQKSQHSVAKSEDDRPDNKGENDEELAVATLVDDMPKAVTSAEAYDDYEAAREKTIFYRRPVFWIVAVLAVLSVTAGMVTMLGGEDDEVDFVTGTLAPTVSPTSAPTEVGPFLLRLELEDAVGTRLVESSPVAFSSAVEWFHVDRSTNMYETMNLQRFALTWFWYHTTNNGLDPWLSCNPPNSARDETKQCSFLDVVNVDFPELCYDTAEDGIRWLSATDECDWSGIQCDDNGIVTSIDLKGAGLKGTFPAFISLLRGLTQLALTYGALSGALPQEISQLTNLQDLTLIGNQLEAPIPDSLFSLPLVKLNLSYNKYEGTIPTSIGNLSSIGGLFLSDNKFAGPLPAELSLATSLEFLQLQRNAFTGSILPTSWGDLVQLQQLHMHDSGLGGTIPKEFSKLVSMSEFWLSHNNLVGPLPDMPWPVIKDVVLQVNSFNGTFPESL